MKANEGVLDRAVRVVVGIALLALGLLNIASGVWLWVATILGAILLITGIVGFCPLYTVLKINTLKK